MSKYISLDALFENPDWQGWHDLSEDFKNGMENVMEYAENLPVIEVGPEAGDYISRKALLEYPIRREHYDKEHGDAHFINGVESVMEYVAQHNVDKLLARYPDGFDSEKSIHRKEYENA